MDLYEVEGKRLMAEYGIPVDAGILYSKLNDVGKTVLPCVVKAQFLSGKRGKMGGILFADTMAELEEAIEKVRKVRINGKAPADILIVPKLSIEREYYLGCILDRSGKRVVLLFTPYGGMDIEEMAIKEPRKLARIPVDGELPRKDWEEAVADFALGGVSEQIYEIACKLIHMFYELDAVTLEINPLVYTGEHTFIAADAKLVIDDNAMFRHPTMPICTHLSILLPTRELNLALGITLILFFVLNICLKKQFIMKPKIYNGLAAGGLGGVLGGFFSLGGIPVGIYLINAISCKDIYYATMQAYLVISDVYGTGIRIYNGLITINTIPWIMTGFVGMLAGIQIGLRIYRKINQELLKKLVYSFIGVSGLYKAILFFL